MPKHANVHVTLTYAPAGTHAEPQAHNARAVQQLPKAQRKAVRRAVSAEIRQLIKAGNLTQASQLAGSMDGWDPTLANYGVTADDWAAHADSQGATQESEAPQAAPQESAPKKPGKPGKNPRKARYEAGSKAAKDAMAEVRSHIGKPKGAPAPKHTAPAPSKTAWEPSDAVHREIYRELLAAGVTASAARWLVQGSPDAAKRTTERHLASLGKAYEGKGMGDASVITCNWVKAALANH